MFSLSLSRDDERERERDSTGETESYSVKQHSSAKSWSLVDSLKITLRRRRICGKALRTRDICHFRGKNEPQEDKARFLGQTTMPITERQWPYKFPHWRPMDTDKVCRFVLENILVVWMAVSWVFISRRTFARLWPFTFVTDQGSGPLSLSASFRSGDLFYKRCEHSFGTRKKKDKRMKSQLRRRETPAALNLSLHKDYHKLIRSGNTNLYIYI